MKLHIHSRLATLAASTDWPHRLSILLAIAPILFLVPLFPFSTVLAQGHGSHGSGSYHSFPAESVAPIPSPAQLWSRIHNSHVGLLRAVPAMSKRDVEYFLKALKDDLNTLSDHPGGLDSYAQTSLGEARRRVKQLSIGLKVAVKSNDAASASAEVARLSEELDRIGQLFPAIALPKADGLKLAPLSADPAPRLTNAVEELRLSPLPTRTLDVGSKAAPNKSQGTRDNSDEVCPTQSGATRGSCSCCGEAPEKTKDREVL